MESLSCCGVEGPKHVLPLILRHEPYPAGGIHGDGPGAQAGHQLGYIFHNPINDSIPEEPQRTGRVKDQYGGIKPFAFRAFRYLDPGSVDYLRTSARVRAMLVVSMKRFISKPPSLIVTGEGSEDAAQR